MKNTKRLLCNLAIQASCVFGCVAIVLYGVSELQDNKSRNTECENKNICYLLTVECLERKNEVSNDYLRSCIDIISQCALNKINDLSM